MAEQEQSTSLHDLPSKFELLIKLGSFAGGFFSYAFQSAIGGPFWARAIVGGTACEGITALFFSLVRGLKNITEYSENASDESYCSMSFWEQHYKRNKQTYLNFGVTSLVALTFGLTAIASDMPEEEYSMGLLLTLGIHGSNNLVDLVAMLIELIKKENADSKNSLLPVVTPKPIEALPTEHTPLLPPKEVKKSYFPCW